MDNDRTTYLEAIDIIEAAWLRDPARVGKAFQSTFTMTGSISLWLDCARRLYTWDQEDRMGWIGDADRLCRAIKENGSVS